VVRGLRPVSFRARLSSGDRFTVRRCALVGADACAVGLLCARRLRDLAHAVVAEAAASRGVVCVSTTRSMVWGRLDRVLAQAEEDADIATLAALRLVHAARIEAERVHHDPLSEDEAVAVVQGVCVRLEAAALAFEAAGRSDLAEIERTDAMSIATLLGVSRG